jgi:hypothetical protein
MPIDKIRVGKRHRLDLGDIAGPVASGSPSECGG